MAASLISMVANFSESKKDKKCGQESERLREVLTKLVDKDARAYERVREAFRLPKESGKYKTKEVEQALKYAAEIPLQTARYSYEVLKLAEVLVKGVKPNIASDVGVASSLAEASIKSALLNVKINLVSIKDEEFKKEINRGIKKIADYLVKTETIFKTVEKKITD